MPLLPGSLPVIELEDDPAGLDGEVLPVDPCYCEMRCLGGDLGVVPYRFEELIVVLFHDGVEPPRRQLVTV